MSAPATNGPACADQNDGTNRRVLRSPLNSRGNAFRNTRRLSALTGGLSIVITLTLLSTLNLRFNYDGERITRIIQRDT